MPNIKSAKKRVLTTSKKALQNKAVKTNLKTVLKKAEAAVIAGAADTKDAIRVAIKKIDQAAAKNIVHKNTAAHKKSALMKKLAAASK
ncbi:30S ribosomal protein S20 [Oscillospiraceae bacterium PP1C4]